MKKVRVLSRFWLFGCWGIFTAIFEWNTVDVCHQCKSKCKV